MQAAVDTIGPAAEKKHLALQLQLDESLPPVSGDPARLQQVVANLLTNAIKFSRTGTRFRDRGLGRGARANPCGRYRRGRRARFPAPYLQPLQPGEPGETRTYGGLGLGLAIVRYLVGAHGGTVHAESAGRGKGSTFTVSLPLMKKSDSRPGEKEDRRVRRSPNVMGIHILVVEDDPGTREALTEMLSLSGPRFGRRSRRRRRWRCSNNPPRSCSFVTSRCPTRMVTASCVGSVHWDRSMVATCLRFSAHGAGRTRRSSQSLEAGFQVHVAKPVDTDRLVAALTRLLKPRAAGNTEPCATPVESDRKHLEPALCFRLHDHVDGDRKVSPPLQRLWES